MINRHYAIALIVVIGIYGLAKYFSFGFKQLELEIKDIKTQQLNVVK